MYSGLLIMYPRVLRPELELELELEACHKRYQRFHPSSFFCLFFSFRVVPSPSQKHDTTTDI